jgi:hypothetical protein
MQVFLSPPLDKARKTTAAYPFEKCGKNQQVLDGNSDEDYSL